MFVPLNDDNPLKIIRFQFVSAFVIALNVAFFLLTDVLPAEGTLMAAATSFGVVPDELVGALTRQGTVDQPLREGTTLLTYMFLHGGWMHLIGNMAFLWVFADNVEDAFGHVGFMLFYLACGVAGAMTHALLLSESHAPLIGASGAVSGVIAAYLLLYPRARVWILFLMKLPLRVPAIVVLGGWILFQVASLFMIQEEGEQIAFLAHIGGFAAGIALTLLFRTPTFARAAATGRIKP